MMNSLPKISLASLCVCCALLSAGLASAEIDVITDTPPPVPRAEREPPHRDGYVWAPGYWEWNGRFFQWISGTWIAERRRFHWVADHWDAAGNRWHHVRGHWEQ